MSSEEFFKVITPLGFSVHVTQKYWHFITTVKHPIMLGKEEIVKNTLKQPDEIRISKSDESVYLFYKKERHQRWSCAIAKQTNDDGFLITTYPTEAIKEGVKIWPR